MASEERKKADEAIKQQNLHNALGAEEQQAETTAFQCSKCKQVRRLHLPLVSYLHFNLRRENVVIARLRPVALMSP